MTEKIELKPEQLKQVAGGTSSESPVVVGPILCEHCGETCNFTYNANEVSGKQGDVRIFCSKCGEYQWVKVGAGL